LENDWAGKQAFIETTADVFQSQISKNRSKILNITLPCMDSENALGVIELQSETNQKIFMDILTSIVIQQLHNISSSPSPIFHVALWMVCRGISKEEFQRYFTQKNDGNECLTNYINSMLFVIDSHIEAMKVFEN
jgi:hypothetical protein